MTSLSQPPQLDHQCLLVGFDPGQHKCGLAVMSVARTIHLHQVVMAERAISTLNQLRQAYPLTLMVMGNQTTSAQWQQRLTKELSPPLPIVTVDERYSTLEARDRYWQLFPPRGLARLIPKGMRVPKGAIDDIVAIILIERYLEIRSRG